MSFFPLTPLLRTLFYWLLTSSITIRKPKALWFLILYCCSFAMSNSLWPHGLQHVRLPCPSLCPEFAQTQVHWISDVIQPSHSLSSPSPPAFNLSQHQGLSMSRFFSSGGQRFGASASASVLPMNIRDWFPLRWTGWISLQSKGLSRVFSNTTVQKHQFFGAQLSSQSNSHIHTWPLEKP